MYIYMIENWVYSTVEYIQIVDNKLFYVNFELIGIKKAWFQT